MSSQMRSFDERLASALDDVAVPDGLRERLLERLQQPASSTGLPPAVVACVQPLGQPSAAPASVPLATRSNRRWWLAAAAAAAGLVLSGRWWLLADRADGDVAQLAASWQQRLTSSWKSMKTLPDGFRVPRSVAVAPQRWQPLDRLAGVSGVAWDLSRPGVGRAVLFVARMTSPGLPGSPPESPQPISGGQTVAGWQAGGLVYILVVQGDLKDYLRLVHLSVDQMA